MINVGIIGLGVGEAHLAAYRLHHGCRVVALCDFDDDKLHMAKEKYPGMKLTKNAGEILSDPEIHLVSIASFDNYHYEQIIEALQNDKHIFVEKPLCLYEKEARHVRKELNARPHLKMSSNLILRVTPRFRDLREKIQKRKLGEIYSVEGDYNYGRIHKLTEGWRGKIPYYSVFYGGGVHMLDLVLWLTGDSVTEVFAYGNRICTEGSPFKYNDNVIAVMKFRSGMLGKFSANFGCVYPHFHKLTVYGTEATFENGLDCGYMYTSKQKGYRPGKLNLEYPAKEKRYMIYNFVDAILDENKKPDVTADEVFQTMSVCYAVEKSLEENRPVTVSYV